MRPIPAKTILGNIKPGADNYFGLRYNMNLYRGCQHGCIYCDSRSLCYQLGELSDIRLKDNAIALLEKELKSKRTKGTIGFGSMNDPYMPVEKDLQITRKALQIIKNFKYPVHIITKSDLVVRDIDILKVLSEIYAAVSITITTANDKLSKLIEPGAPLSSSRFNALQKLSEAGIYCGITLMPILPFINDSCENIHEIVLQAKQSGASYILALMGMTLREGQREYYYSILEKKFPGIKEKYIATYGDRYSAESPNHKQLYSIFQKTCQEVGMQTKMEFYKPSVPKQLSLFEI